MTFALQMGDTATFRMAKQRLREVLIDWYTYTPGEQRFYFARYPRWGALIGFDTSYDSDTFNDHHFHYGYFVYASAILCMLDDDFRTQYGAMAREVARDYANWQRSADQPWFRTLDPYCGHSFAGGLGNGGNGNGQESTSEAIQGWGGVYMLGAALQDKEMLEAGIMGYTLETRATAEYWFDRQRRNIDYTKYQHPYCCNLTMQGVGWWTWFSGDPVWMHSIQWLPISPVLTNHFCEDLAFTRWDYTEMYSHKEVGDYESASGGLGDESGLGNVCLSYLSLFDADSAARVWDRMDRMGKPLAKTPTPAVSPIGLRTRIVRWARNATTSSPTIPWRASIPTPSADKTPTLSITPATHPSPYVSSAITIQHSAISNQLTPPSPSRTD